PVELAVVSLEDPDQPTLTPDMQREALAVRTPIERVSLPLVDQPAVDWRRVVFAHETKATRTLATTPAMCARLGQLVGVDRLHLHLAGSLGALRLEADGIVPWSACSCPFAEKRTTTDGPLLRLLRARA